MGPSPIVFSATGEIQTFFVPVTGGYLIEACGAQVAASDGTAPRADRVKGLFYLHRGDVLKIVVGSQEPSPHQRRHLPGAAHGGSIVWRGSGDLPLPAKLMLAASGGSSSPQAQADDEAAPYSFNAGAFQVNLPGVHGGAGYVSITPVSAPAAHCSTDGIAPASRAAVTVPPPERHAAPAREALPAPRVSLPGHAAEISPHSCAPTAWQ